MKERVGVTPHSEIIKGDEPPCIFTCGRRPTGHGVIVVVVVVVVVGETSFQKGTKGGPSPFQIHSVKMR